MVIAWDYILVMTMFCTATVIYHNRYEKRGNCCKSCCAGRMDVALTSTHVGRQASIDNHNSTGASLDATPEEFKAQSESKVSYFYDKVFSKFILNRNNRFVIFFVCLAWFAVAAVFTSKLEPTTETEQFLDSEHPLQKSITILGSAFPTAARDRGAVVTFSWGIGELDRTGVNQLRNTTYFGEPSYIEGWELNPQCQEHILR